MRNLLISLSLVLLPFLASCQDKVDRYTTNYADIAISEMHRSGIPASITLAQGMFESGYGESESAMSYNNHFGIKCKKEWTGPFYYKKDDDRDKYGKLIESCFRAYPTVLESYQDHTNFLIERDRYAELFTFHQTDYVNWALGLERCGYATNKMYAERLIEIIERYSLNQYDQVERITAVQLTTPPLPVGTPDTDVFAEQSAISEIATSEIETPSTELEGRIIATYSEEDLFKTVEIPVILETTLAPTKIDSIPPTKLIIEEKATEAPINRVNKAIILPAKYQRSTQTTNVGQSKMK